MDPGHSVRDLQYLVSFSAYCEHLFIRSITSWGLICSISIPTFPALWVTWGAEDHPSCLYAKVGLRPGQVAFERQTISVPFPNSPHVRVFRHVRGSRRTCNLHNLVSIFNSHQVDLLFVLCVCDITVRLHLWKVRRWFGIQRKVGQWRQVERKSKGKTGNCDSLALVSQTHRMDVSAQLGWGKWGGRVRTSTSSLHQSV